MNIRPVIFFPVFLFLTNLSYAQYCTATTVGSSTNIGIVNFTISNLSNNSPDMQGYVNYTNLSATVYRTSIYNLYVYTANPSMQDVGVWVDWNQDGDFNDPGEKIAGPGKYNNASPHKERIRIPSTATLGSTRLRVVSDTYGNPIDSCTTTQAAGDIEDYTLIIRDTVYATATQYLSPQFTSPAVEKKVLGIELFSSTNFALSSITFNTNGTSNPGAISNAKVFYSGDDYSFANTQFGATIAAPAGTFTVNGAQIMQPGLNYLWLTYDVNGNPGDVIDAQLESLVINSTTVIPAVISPPEKLTIKPPVCNYNPKRNNIWYFGNKAGVDFNGASPVALTNSVMNHHEGSASIADINGNLLFYTDGSLVYDRTHTQMPNGFGLGGNTSTTQSAIILQQPDNDSIYYIFTQKAQASADSLGEPAGFYYSIVDMSKNGGMGDVIIKRTILLNFATEKQTAFIHSNKKDIWILCHEFGNDSYYAYVLTATGIKDPTVTSSGYAITNGLEALGAIKVSPDGSKVASAIAGNSPSIGNMVELFDFNTTTGVLSNLKTITLIGNACPYGVAFSPNSNLLYISENCSGVLGQYNATLATGPAIAASKFIVSGSLTQGQLELAPNGKIYSSGTNPTTSLGVINNPNTSGAGCGFVSNGFNLGGNQSNIGLPSQFIPAPPPIAMAGSPVSVCPGTSVQLTASGGPAYSWLPSHGISILNNYTVTANPTTSTTYSFVVSNNGSCPDTASVNITVFPSPSVSISGDTVICKGAATSLTASGTSTYNWSPSAGLSATTGSTVNSSATVFTTYTVIGTDGNGCNDTTTIDITASDPLITITGDTVICPGISTTLTAGGAANYTWLPGSGLSSTTGNIVIANPPSASNYTVTGIDIFGCSDTLSFTILTNGIIVSLNGSTSICYGDSAILTAAGASNYTWLPAQGLSVTTGNMATVYPTGNTTYTVIGANSLGCNDTTTLNINVNLLPVVTVSNNDTICKGSSTTISAGGGISYQWSPAGTLSSSSNAISLANPTNTTTYLVDVSNGNCISTGSVTITVLNPPVTGTSGNITISQGNSTTLSASGGTSYSWSPANGLNCITCQSPAATPGSTTKYYVLITDENGCTNIDSLTVTVDIICEDIFVPNAFSPNGDGENDNYFIYGDCISWMHLTIYNRWGEIVFESENITEGWDGKVKNKEDNTAVFTYQLNAALRNGENISKKGNISLVR